MTKIHMLSDKKKFILILLSVILFHGLAGCSHKEHKSDTLYYDPPPRLINDYTGMIEAEEVNWAWLRLGCEI